MLARLLDRAIRIPGTNIGIGLDPLLGLVPGLGDALAVGFSGYIIVEAARAGASRGLLLRMLWNVALDAVLGAVPVVGDAFDVAWGANIRNVELFAHHLADPNAGAAAGHHFVILVVAVLAGVAVAAAALVVLLATLLVRVVSR